MNDGDPDQTGDFAPDFSMNMDDEGAGGGEADFTPPDFSADFPTDAENAPADDAAISAATGRLDGGAVVPDLEDGLAAPPDRRKKAVLGVPIEVVISVGRARPRLSELVALRRDSVLTLDRKIEDPVEIMIGDKVIARGELQEIEGEEGRLGVRLTEVADLSQSL